MNKKQKLFSCITGYEHNSSFNSARDEFYYDNCKTKSEKIQQLKDYQNNALNDCDLEDSDYDQIYNAIECEKNSTNDWFYTYENLNK